MPKYIVFLAMKISRLVKLVFEINPLSLHRAMGLFNRATSFRGNSLIELFVPLLPSNNWLKQNLHHRSYVNHRLNRCQICIGLYTIVLFYHFSVPDFIHLSQKFGKLRRNAYLCATISDISKNSLNR